MSDSEYVPSSSEGEIESDVECVQQQHEDPGGGTTTDDGPGTEEPSQTVRCRYSPLCEEVFITEGEMQQHCRTMHKEALGKFWCQVCTERWALFNTAKQLRRHHGGTHTTTVCPKCSNPTKKANLKRHIKRCNGSGQGSTKASSPSIGGASVSIDRGNDISDATGPVTSGGCHARTSSLAARSELTQMLTLPVFARNNVGETGRKVTRSKHRGPRQEVFETKMPAYYAWLKSPTVAGHRKFGPTQLLQHCAKFRTFLGKFAHFHSVDIDTMMLDLDDDNGWRKYFEGSRLEDYSLTLGFADDGRELKQVTSYNLVVQIKHFLYWKVKTKQCAQMNHAYDLIVLLKDKLGEDKKRERDPEEKAEYISGLPTVPEVLSVFNNELKIAVKEARVTYEATKRCSWNLYRTFRDYVLVMLLFALPPQRAQVYNSLKTSNISSYKKSKLLTIDKHKTMYKYGPVIIAIPEKYVAEFDMYLVLRDGIASESGDCSLFVDASGKREPYLTKQFTKLMMNLFSRRVTLLDCRSIYITWAYSILTANEMAVLADRMYHSYETQQRYYESTATKRKAVDTLHLTNWMADNASADTSSTNENTGSPSAKRPRQV